MKSSNKKDVREVYAMLLLQHLKLYPPLYHSECPDIRTYDNEYGIEVTSAIKETFERNNARVAVNETSILKAIKRKERKYNRYSAVKTVDLFIGTFKNLYISNVDGYSKHLLQVLPKTKYRYIYIEVKGYIFRVGTTVDIFDISSFQDACMDIAIREEDN